MQEASQSRYSGTMYNTLQNPLSSPSEVMQGLENMNIQNNDEEDGNGKIIHS